MSRTAAVARIPSSVSMLERLISAGNSVPSLRTAKSSTPAPIGRVRGSAKYPRGGRGEPRRTAGHQHLDRLAEQLLAPVAEQRLGLLVDEDDLAALRHADDRVGGELEQLLEHSLGRAGAG